MKTLSQELNREPKGAFMYGFGEEEWLFWEGILSVKGKWVVIIMMGIE